MKNTRLALCTVLFAAVMLAQQPLTNDSVLKLVKANMGDDLIVNMINTQPSTFSLTADDLIALKAAGASDKVISAMVTKGSATAPAGLTTSVPSAAGPVHELGVYYKKADAWQDLEPEVINFKTGGVLKSMATNGITMAAHLNQTGRM